MNKSMSVPATTKLHIGCGAKYLPGYIHVDVLPFEHVHVVCDLRKLHEHFAENTLHEIYACHVLEHLGRREVADVLSNLSTLLAPGGTIRIAVPDIEQVMRMYSAGALPLSALYGFLWGGQRDEFDVHKIGFDMSSLTSLLYENGFGRVERYRWQEFLPPSYDDYSKSYIPHMDFEHGQLMSLNVIAQKKKDVYIFCTGGFTNAINSIVGVLHFAKRMRYRVHILWLEGYIANDICLQDVFDVTINDPKDQIEFHNEREFMQRVQNASHAMVACTHNTNIPCLKGFRGHVIDPRIVKTAKHLADVTEPYHALFFHTDVLPPFACQRDTVSSFFETFRFKESLIQEAKTFIVGHDARVGLHIRGTDLLSTTNYTMDDIEMFARSIVANHANELPIVICTDDEHVDARLSQFPDLFVMRGNKSYVKRANESTSWFDDAGTDHIHCGHMVHQGRIYKQYSSLNVVRTKEQILGGIVDLLILAMLNNIYCFHTSATSTYYSFAKLLNQLGLFKLF